MLVGSVFHVLVAHDSDKRCEKFGSDENALKKGNERSQCLGL